MTRREKLIVIVERFISEGFSLGDLRDNVVAFKTNGGSGLVNYVDNTYSSLDAAFAPEDPCADQKTELSGIIADAQARLAALS